MEIPKRPTSPQAVKAMDAALKILGEQGVRALSHARIDKEAELPPGSTSNYFRTRQSLLEGLVAHLAKREQEDFSTPLPLLNRQNAEDAFVEMLEVQCAMFRGRTLARFALFTDMAGNPESLSPLIESRQDFERWTALTLAVLGSTEPEEDTPFFMATLDGALFHRLCIDKTLDFRPIVSRALDACSE